MIDFFKRHPYFIRSVYRRGYEKINPLFFDVLNVNEFPKSGGTWVCRMLRDCLDWRLDDNAFPRPGNAIVKHHRLRFAHAPTITVIRDPRDVAVSYFYHCRRTFEAHGFNRYIVELMSEKVFSKFDTHAEEMEAFVEVLLNREIYPSFTWGDFYRAPDRAGTVWVRYEDLRSDPAPHLERVLREVGLSVPNERIDAVAKGHNIERILQQRRDNKGAHFIRKGKVGGWREELDDRSVKLIEQDAGALLEKYGYA